MRLDDFDFELPRELIADCIRASRARPRVCCRSGVGAARRQADRGSAAAAARRATSWSSTTPTSSRRGLSAAAGRPRSRSRCPRSRRRRLARLRQGREAAAARRPPGLRRGFRRRDRREAPGGRRHAALRSRGRRRSPPRSSATARCRCRPIIKRRGGGDPRDRVDYQTIFARAEGAVAAPTAGLHFTPGSDRSARRARASAATTVTLHVGAGTFLPVKADDPRDHQMHGEWGVLDAATAARDQRGARRAAGASSRSARPACASWRAPRRESGAVAAVCRRDRALHHCRAIASARSTCC